MGEILLIVTGVAGILQIILFFKIWVMTDDVKAIKSREPDLLKQAHLSALKGDKEKARELLYDRFLGEVIDVYNGNYTDYYCKEKYTEIKNRYSAISKGMGLGNMDFEGFDDRDKIKLVYNKKIL